MISAHCIKDLTLSTVRVESPRQGLRGCVAQVALGVGEIPASGEDEPGQPSRGDRWAVGVEAALVDVAHQQVRTALVTQGLDLGKQPCDGNSGVLGSAPAQMFTVGVDQRGPIGRGPAPGVRAERCVRIV